MRNTSASATWRDFCDAELAPYARDLDRTEAFPADLVPKLFEVGFPRRDDPRAVRRDGPRLPPLRAHHGGSGPDRLRGEIDAVREPRWLV